MKRRAHAARPARLGPTRLAGLCTALILAPPLSAAPFPQIPSAKFLVKNNSLADLQCATRTEGGEWTPYFPIAAGGEWSMLGRTGQTLSIFCGAPVERTVFSIKAGKRYSLLPKPGTDVISLIRIEVPEE